MSDEIWNYERVQRMIDDGVEENLHLDYKAAGSLAKIDKKKDEIVKDVTAFANSDGGLIIYGVREHTNHAKKHLPDKLDPINRAEFSKEWLEQVISNASPRIHGLRIYPISVPSDETKCLYVVEIPRGETAHQSVDCKYYRRYNFESVAMRDHEVRDVMNRIKVPRLEVEAFLGIRNPWEESNLMFEVANVSKRMALHYAITVKMPLSLDGVLSMPKQDNLIMDRDEAGHYYHLSMGNGLMGHPLFPSASVKLSQEICCNVSRHVMKDGTSFITRPYIDVRVYADEMTPLELQFDPSLIRKSCSKPKSLTSMQI